MIGEVKSLRLVSVEELPPDSLCARCAVPGANGDAMIIVVKEDDTEGFGLLEYRLVYHPRCWVRECGPIYGES